jgi:hypothetical protein
MKAISWFGAVLLAAGLMSGCFMFAGDCVALGTPGDSFEYLGNRAREAGDNGAANERVAFGEPGDRSVVGNGQYCPPHWIDDPDDSSSRRRVVADLLLERGRGLAAL